MKKGGKLSSNSKNMRDLPDLLVAGDDFDELHLGVGVIVLAGKMNPLTVPIRQNQASPQFAPDL